MSKAFVKGIHDVNPIWQVEILWAVLAEAKDTDNSFSFMWELCPKNSGPGPHYHNQHEGFFVVDGSITYLADGEKLIAGPHSFVWIPKGTVHSFRVDTKQATLLNFYTPGGFEQAILQLGQKAKAFTIPPKDFKDNFSRNKAMEIFQQIGMHIVNEPDVLRREI
jgi:quercetin dioxygenase-like cupin family protein